MIPDRRLVAAVPRLLATSLAGILVAAVGAYAVRGAVTPGDPVTPAHLAAGSLSVHGSATELLYPGRGAPLDLVVTNRNDFALRVGWISASVAERTSAPRCSGSANFRTRGLRGSFVLPAQTSSRLSELGVPRAAMPRIELRRRAVDQGACEGARVSLSYVAGAIPL